MKKKFLSNLRAALEISAECKIEMNYSFRNLEEWDSLSELSFIAMLDEEYGIELESGYLDELITVEDLFSFVKSKL